MEHDDDLESKLSRIEFTPKMIESLNRTYQYIDAEIIKRAENAVKELIEAGKIPDMPVKFRSVFDVLAVLGEQQSPEGLQRLYSWFLGGGGDPYTVDDHTPEKPVKTRKRNRKKE